MMEINQALRGPCHVPSHRRLIRTVIEGRARARVWLVFCLWSLETNDPAKLQHCALVPCRISMMQP